MSLVSNFIGEISSSQFGSVVSKPKFDLNDDTFSNLLNKQLEQMQDVQENSILENLGVPTGFNIENIDETDFLHEQNNQLDAKNENFSNITTSETATFYNSLLNSAVTETSELFDFARRHATNLYQQYSKSVITDVNEFVEDVRNIK